MSQIEELIQECENMEKETATKAVRMKIFNILFNLIIIIIGTVIGLVSVTTDSFYKYWITLTLGFSVSLLKMISSLFRFETRSNGNMQVSIKMRQFIRKLKKVRRKKLSEDEIEEALDYLGKEFDELRLSVFTDGAMKRVNSVARKSPKSSATTSTTDETQTVQVDIV